MRNSTEPNTLLQTDRVVPSAPRAHCDTRTQHRDAANDAVVGAMSETAPYARPTSYDMHRAARTHRSRLVGELIAEALYAVVAFANQAWARHQVRRQARIAHDALRSLNDHTLRDLGFDRSEIASVAAEVTGGAARTRVRALLTPHTLS